MHPEARRIFTPFGDRGRIYPQSAGSTGLFSGISHCIVYSAPLARNTTCALCAQLSNTKSWQKRVTMDNPSLVPDISRPALPLLHGQFARSLSSTQSIASAFGPGTSTPSSWKASNWLRGTPDTSPPSSGAGSPELKPKPPPEDCGISPVLESLGAPEVDDRVKNICFVGAGFVGNYLGTSVRVVMGVLTFPIRWANGGGDSLPQPGDTGQRS